MPSTFCGGIYTFLFLLDAFDKFVRDVEKNVDVVACLVFFWGGVSPHSRVRGRCVLHLVWCSRIYLCIYSFFWGGVSSPKVLVSMRKRGRCRGEDSSSRPPQRWRNLSVIMAGMEQVLSLPASAVIPSNPQSPGSPTDSRLSAPALPHILPLCSL